MSVTRSDPNYFPPRPSLPLPQPVLYPFDHCLACGGPVKIEKGGNNLGHYLERITCLRGCKNCYKAWMEHNGRTIPPQWARRSDREEC